MRVAGSSEPATPVGRVKSRRRSITVPATHLDRWLHPMTAPVTERVSHTEPGLTELEAVDGPFSHYRRTVHHSPVADGPVGHSPADLSPADLSPADLSTADLSTVDAAYVRIDERVELRVAMPFVGGLLTRFYLRALITAEHTRDELPGKTPAWSPPEPLNPRAGQVLGALLGLAFVFGYLGTVLTTTITFAAREFGATTGAQAVALAMIRGDILIGLPIATLADRLGRRRVLRITALVGTIGTALCSLAPSLGGLVVLQLPTRGSITASVTIVGVILVEEMPARSRSWSAGALVAAAATGSALTLVLAAAADLGERGWRFVFAAPALAIPLVVRALRHVPESRRFAAHRTVGSPAADQRSLRRRSWFPVLRPHLRRLGLLAAGTAMLSLFVTPAAQFNNDFLRRERGFSAGAISMFGLLTAAPGAVGLLFGGRIADTRGKRRVVGIGVLVGSITKIAFFQSSHWPLWVWAIVGSIVAGIALPGQAIYTPELFPTSVRAGATAVATFAGRVGGIIGLLTAGWLGHNDRLGSAISWLGLGGLAMGALVLVAYPETAGRELEDLNPSDANQSATTPATGPSRRFNE